MCRSPQPAGLPTSRVSNEDFPKLAPPPGGGRQRPQFMAGFALVAFAVVAASCAGKPKVRGPRPITAALYQHRLALGAVAYPLGNPVDERVRMRRLADYARNAGMRAETLYAVRSYLAGCRVDALLAKVEGGDAEAVAATAKVLREAQQLAITTGIELHAPMLVLDAIGEPPQPGQEYAAEYLAAYRRLAYRSNEAGFRAALALAAGDERALLDLHRLSRGAVDGPSPERQTLLAGGAQATLLLMNRWQEAQEDGDKPAIVQAARDVVSADPLQLRPRLALLYYEEVAGKVIDDRPQVAEAITARHENGTGFVRVEQALAAKPRSVSLRLGLVFRYYTAGLMGDAHVALTKLESRLGLTTSQRGVAQQLRAMLDLAAGDLHSYRSWASASGGDRSPFIAQLEIDSSPSTEANLWSELAASARRRALRLDLPTEYTWMRDRGVATDVIAPAALRKQAIERLWRNAPTSALGAAHCLERSLSEKDCEALLAALFALDDDEELPEEPLEILLQVAPVVDRAPYLLLGLSGAAPKPLAKILPWLKEREVSYLGASTAYASLRARAHLAAGDLAGAAAWLESHGAMLLANERFQLRLAIDDLRHKRATVEQVLGYLSVDYEVPQSIRLRDNQDWDWIDEETYVGELGRFRRGCNHWSEADPAAVLEHLVPLMDRTDDRDGGVLALYVLLAADAVGKGALRDRALAILRAQVGAEARTRFAEAELARHQGSALQFRARVGEVWALHPRDIDLELAYLEALGRAEPGAGALAKVRQALTVQGHNPGHTFSWLQDALEAGQLDRGQGIVKALAAKRDPAAAVALGDAGAAISTLAGAAHRHFNEQILAAADAARARALAVEAVTYLERVADADERAGARTWLHFLAGDGAAVRRVALTPVGDDGEAPFSEEAAVVVLASERTAGIIDDETAWAMWKHNYNRSGKPLDLAQRLLDISKSANGGLTVACRMLVDADLQQEAMVPCWRAWQGGGSSADLAIAVSYLLVNGEEQAGTMGIDIAEFFAEVKARVSAEDATWLRNLSYWHRKHGRVAEAAEAARQAWSGGSVWTDYPSDDELRESRFRGSLVRFQIRRGRYTDGANQASLLTYGALYGGDVEAARFYARVQKAQARTEGLESEPALETFVHGLLDLLAADLSSAALDVEGIADFFALVAGSGDIAPFCVRYPRSRLAKLLRVESQTTPIDERVRLIAELLELAPNNVLLVVDAVPLLIAHGERDRAELLLAAGMAANPDSESLRRLKLPKESESADVSWLRDPQRFMERLGKITAKQLAERKPTFRSNSDNASSGFFPGGYEDHWRLDPAAVSPDHTWTAVASFPRAAMCEGLTCLQGMSESFADKGFSEIWHSKATTPAGRGASLLVEGNGNIILITVIPLGGRLFALYYGGPLQAAARNLVDYRLLHDSFRPLDRWLSADRGHAMRSNGAYLLTDTQRYALDTELRGNSARAGCPITQSLRALANDQARAQALLEAMLVARDDSARARLLSCSPADARPAARLGLLTLLSADPREFRYGLKVAARFPHETRVDASAALLAGDGVAVSAQSRKHSGERPPEFGVLQVLAVLPEEQRKRLAGDLVRSTRESDRFLALAAGGLIDDSVDPELLRIAIRNSPPSSAALAALSVFEHSPDKLDLIAARKRLDSIKGPLDSAGRELLAALASGLADRLDRRDRARLDRAVKLAGKASDADEQGAADSLVSYLTWKREIHTLGLSMKGRDPSDPPADLDSDGSHAWNLVVALAKQPGAAPTPIPDAQLRSLPLPAILDGKSWSYVRIGQPGLFAATIRNMLRRVRGPSPGETATLQRVGLALAENSTIGVFAEDGGLDLSRPIECASPGDVRSGHVCSAFLSDADRARSHLIRRTVSSGSGLLIPMQLAFGGVYAPMAAAAAPMMIHYMLASEGSGEGGRVVAKERVRSTIRIAGRELERYSVVHVEGEGGTALSSDYYLFLEDRVFLFSDPRLAERFLTELPAASAAFAANPSYRAAAKSWSDGGALQAFALAGATSTFDEDTALEVAADSSGVSFRIPIGKRGEFRDASRGAAWLPEGAVSSLTMGVGPDSSFSSGPGRGASWDLPAISGVDVGTAPPTWLLPAAREISFAWYGPTGSQLWGRWVAVIDHGRRVARALRSRRFRAATTSKIHRRAGLHYTLHDGMLIVGSNQELVAKTVARARRAVAPGSPVLLRGRLRSDLLGDPVRKLAGGMRAGDSLRQVVAVFAIFAGALESADFDAELDKSSGMVVLRARFEPNLADAEVDLEVVDQWLASPALRNSAALPRVLSPRELEQPLALVVKVADARTVAANVFAGTPRLKVAVVDSTHLRLTIRPGAKASEPIPAVALDATSRSAMLRKTAVFTVSHPKVKAVLAGLNLDKKYPVAIADKVIAWVKKNIRYEITPAQLDAVAILRRGRGDCTEFSVLAVTLLRAAGVPAELREGMAMVGGDMVAHAWIAYHDGQGWREADPTAGATAVGAGHLETSLMDFISLISIGGLEIVSIESP